MNSRNQSLDLLRGVAILLVLGRHSSYYSFWERIGWIGVDLFFVLSGFLISGLLFTDYKRTGNINWRRFFIRRSLKIYPPYYFFAFLLLPYTYHSVHVADFTFMHAYWQSLWRHGWSLSVEEHFYILLPIILVLSLKLSLRSPFRWIPYAFPVIVLACLAMRLHLGPGAEHHSTDATHLHIDALFAGVTLSWFHHFTESGIRTKHSLLIALIGFVILLPACFFDLREYIAYTVGFTTNLIGFSCILVAAINSKWLPKVPLLSSIGRYSYSIYLWHWPIAWGTAVLWSSGFISFWGYVLLSLAIGIIASEIIEFPVLKLRDKFFPSQVITPAHDASALRRSAPTRWLAGGVQT
jgi:peptidoglycan/LPS O-acetylase OafA/YrhL